jgi:hypothetical protein
MEDYKLNRWDLNNLIHVVDDLHQLRMCYIHNHGYGAEKEGWRDADKYIQSLKYRLEPSLFNSLLLKQPELASDLENFWKQCETARYAESVFSEIFTDKIFLKNVHEQLLINSYSSQINNSERRKFVKEMIVKSPSLMMDLHNHLKTNHDHVLLYAYTESLPKYLNQIDDTKENIWERLKKLDLPFDSTAANLLTPIVKSFKHDKDFYNVLKEIFSPKFEKYHNLREKFSKIEDKYFKKFKVDENIELFDNHQAYSFSFFIQDRVLIDSFGINKNSVEEVKSEIHECIKTFLNKCLPKSGLYYSYSQRGFDINTPNFNDKPRIDLYMHHIQPIIKNILSSLPEKDKTFPNKENVCKMFESALLKIELDDSLSSREISKPKKHKL